MTVYVRFLAPLFILLCETGTSDSAVRRIDRQVAPQVPVAIIGVTIIDVNAPDISSARRTGQTVLIERGDITRIGPAATVPVPRGAHRVDGRGGYLIPGLWDAHAHVSQGAGPAALAAYVANGITTLRDLGGRISDVVIWQQQMRDGAITGPRLFKAGTNLEGAWWLDPAARLLANDPALGKFPLFEVSPRLRLASPAHASAAVESIVRLGADLIKFRNLRGDEFRAVAAEAKRRGLALVGHAPGRLSIGEAAEIGMRSVEHAETVTLSLGDADNRERLAQLARVAASRTAITPTLVADVAYRQTPDTYARAVISDADNRRDSRRRYVTRSLLDAWRFGLDIKRFDAPTDWAESHRRQVADMQLAHKLGVPLLVGTDLGVSLVYPGFSVHDELRLLVDEVKLSTLDALRAATVNPARNMGVADTVGGITAGQRADLVLLEADPLHDIRNAARIRAVVLNGRVLARAEIDSLLVTAERVARASHSGGR